MKFQPVIKWSGSKRSQVNEIIKTLPNKIKTYYEPFVGGGSILRGVMQSDIEVDRYVCSDINSDLIGLWNMIKENPSKVSDKYEEMWHEMNDEDDDKDRKRDYFYMVRDRFNKDKDPLDFMFIMRTTTNGMPRYNLKGDFNNSFHITRNGVQPKTLHKIICEWSEMLNENNVEFIHQSYQEIQTNIGDFMYLDPPYANTKGMYYGALDYGELWDWMRKQPCNYSLSFDGVSGDIDSTYNVPKDVYDKHEYLLSGNSSFKRTIGKSNDSIVYESLYVKHR